MYFVDSNVFFYAIVSDVRYGQACSSIVRDIADGKIEAAISSLVVIEVANALHRYGKSDLAEGCVDAMCSLPIVIEAVDVVIAREATRISYQAGISPYDSVHVAVMRRLGISEIVSADTDFDRVNGIKRLDPLRCYARRTSRSVGAERS